MLHIFYQTSITIWRTSKTYIRHVQRLQNRAARIICNNFDIINVSDIHLVNKLESLTISQRIDYFLCLYVYRCIHSIALSYLSNSIAMASNMHDRQTRLNATMNAIVPSIRTAALCKYITYKGAVAWNALPGDVKCSHSLSMFKCKLKRYIRTV